MKSYVLLVALLINLVSAKPEVEVCEVRPKFTFNILDALVVDTVEFMLESSCNRTEPDPFDSVFWCFAKILDLPSMRLAWSYRNQQPRIVGLKNFFCSHAQEAAKCHDFDIGTDSFSCPTGYADSIRQIADIFVKTTYDVYCGGDGNPMINLIAAHGDACLNQGRSALMDCMYRALPTLQRISDDHFSRLDSNARQSTRIRPACNALEVVRHCASQTYVKCSTSIPANSLDQLLEALSESIKCPNFYLRRSLNIKVETIGQLFSELIRSL